MRLLKKACKPSQPNTDLKPTQRRRKPLFFGIFFPRSKPRFQPNFRDFFWNLLSKNDAFKVQFIPSRQPWENVAKVEPSGSGLSQREAEKHDNK